MTQLLCSLKPSSPLLSSPPSPPTFAGTFVYGLPLQRCADLMTVDHATGLDLRLSRLVNGSLSVQDIHIDSASVLQQNRQRQAQEENRQQHEQEQEEEHDQLAKISAEVQNDQHSSNPAASHHGNIRNNLKMPGILQQRPLDGTSTSASCCSLASSSYFVSVGTVSRHRNPALYSSAPRGQTFSPPLMPSLSPPASRSAHFKTPQSEAGGRSSEELALRASWRSGREERAQRRHSAQASERASCG